MKSRITRIDFPPEPRKCVISPYCVYRDEDGVCDEPSNNCYNSDALCYKWAPVFRLGLLAPVAETDEWICEICGCKFESENDLSAHLFNSPCEQEIKERHAERSE